MQYKINMKILNLFSILIFLSSLFLYVIYDKKFYFIAFQIILYLLLLSVYFYAHYVRYNKLYYTSFSILFLLGYSIVYFQMPLLYSLGFRLTSQFDAFVWSKGNLIFETTSVALISISAYVIGFTSNVKFSTKKNNIIVGNTTLKLLVIFTYIFYILYFLNSGSYMSGNYSAGDESGLAKYFSKLFNIFLFSSIVVSLVKLNNKISAIKGIKSYISNFYKPLIILITWHILFSFYVGDRGPIITLGLLVSSLYFFKVRSVGFIKIFIILIVAASIMSIISQIRSRDSNDSFFSRLIVATSLEEKSSTYFSESSPGEGTLELALSIRTLSHSIDKVPNEYDYQYGLYQAQYFAGIVPGLRSTLNNLIYDGNQMFNGSANFISYQIQGGKPKYGDGSSIIADLYLDFGVLGCVFVMFFFGLIIKNLEYSIIKNKLVLNFGTLFIFMFISKSIYLSRSTLALELSNIVFSYLIIAIFCYFLRVKK